MSTGSVERLLIAYDGSRGARRALATAAVVAPRAAAFVAYARDPVTLRAAPVAAPGVVLPAGAPDEVDAAAAAQDRQVAEEGVELAAAAGLRAMPLVVDGGGAGRSADALMAAAEEHDADLLVIGARAHGGLVSTVLGSVSDRLVHHSDRPVLVVPDPS